jgi:hypothetical protein
MQLHASAVWSRNAAIVNSQGRQPLEVDAVTIQKPQRGDRNSVAPLGLKSLSSNASRGLCPWLLTVAPLGLLSDE